MYPMFSLRMGSDIRFVTKIQADEFTPHHRDILQQACLESGNLILPDPQWASQCLGAGEEKAVFCVRDSNQRVFAVEVLDERTYLNGRFVGGEYFFDLRIPGLSQVKLNPASLYGLTFTGKVRVREFVHGYEWARFQFDARRRSRFDQLLTHMLQTCLAAQFENYRSRYKDVHARNVLFELRQPPARGVPLVVRDWVGAFRLVTVGLQPIDVR
jgi:hypothetical protein